MKKILFILLLNILTLNLFPNNLKLKIGKYELKNDNYCYFIIYDDNIFKLEVNLCEGQGSIYGNYNYEYNKIYCKVEKKTFSGFIGDNIRNFYINILSEDVIEYEGSRIGCAPIYKSIFNRVIDEKCIIKNDNIKIYNKPSTSSKVINYLNKNSKIEIVEYGTDEKKGIYYFYWVKIKHNNKIIGWCNYFKLTKL